MDGRVYYYLDVYLDCYLDCDLDCYLDDIVIVSGTFALAPYRDTRLKQGNNGESGEISFWLYRGKVSGINREF